MSGKHDYQNQQQNFQHPCHHHSAIRKHSGGSFPGKLFWRFAEGRADSRLELLPWGRPFHQQPRRLGPLGNTLRNGFYHRTHAASVSSGRSIRISTWSPNSVLVSLTVPVGNSSTDVASTRMAAILQGFSSCSMWMTILSWSRYTASIGKRMARVWTPWQGTIHSPWPRRKRAASVAIRPRKRDQCVRAI